MNLKNQKLKSQALRIRHRFGFDEYSTKEPIADDEPVLAEIEELEKPEIDELEKPELEEPSFTHLHHLVLMNTQQKSLLPTMNRLKMKCLNMTYRH